MNTIKEIEFLLKKLFPINRGLVTKDNLKTLRLIKKILPIKILSVKILEKC